MTNHLLLMSDLQPLATYWFQVTSVDASTNSATSPAAPAQPARFESGRLDCGIADLTLRCAPQVPGCGNATIDPGGDCDDGGVRSGDGCSSVCAFESQDMDNDGILNDYETGTGVYVSPTDTGTRIR